MDDLAVVGVQRAGGESVRRIRFVPLSLVASVVAASLFFAVPEVRAYSDASGFASNPLDDGGGGGRWFTGSPADGYTCAVCHSGAPGPVLSVQGLPIDGYIPGAMYEVTVDWPDTLLRAGASAEITDERGVGAGTVHLPEGGAMDVREECAAEFGQGILATQRNDVPVANPQLPARVVLNVAACGAQRMRFLWVAPNPPMGTLWLSGAIVDSNGMADVNGDGVTNFARPIGVGMSVPVASTVGGCSTLGLRSLPATPVAWPWLAWSAWLLVRRVSRRRTHHRDAGRAHTT